MSIKILKSFIIIYDSNANNRKKYSIQIDEKYIRSTQNRTVKKSFSREKEEAIGSEHTERVIITFRFPGGDFSDAFDVSSDSFPVRRIRIKRK